MRMTAVLVIDDEYGARLIWHDSSGRRFLDCDLAFVEGKQVYVVTARIPLSAMAEATPQPADVDPGQKVEPPGDPSVKRWDEI